MTGDKSSCRASEIVTSIELESSLQWRATHFNEQVALDVAELNTRLPRLFSLRTVEKRLVVKHRRGQTCAIEPDLQSQHGPTIYVLFADPELSDGLGAPWLKIAKWELCWLRDKTTFT